MNAALRKLVVAPLTPLLRTAARSYVAGPRLADATAVAQSLARRGHRARCASGTAKTTRRARLPAVTLNPCVRSPG